MKDEALDYEPCVAGVDPAPGSFGAGRGSDESRVASRTRHKWVNESLPLQRELPYLLLRWDGKRSVTHWALNEVAGEVRPFHFANADEGDDRFWQLLERASRDRVLVVGECLGFSDFCVALPADPEGHTFFYGGPFLTKELDWEGVVGRWRPLARGAPVSANPEFMRFVRTVLRLPVLDARTLKVLEELLTSLSQPFALQRSDSQLSERVAKLKREVFERVAFADDALARALEPEAPLPQAWTRSPTTVLALMPAYPQHQAQEPAQTLVRHAQLQRAVARFASQLPDTAALRLEDYGVAILTSVAPSKNPQLGLLDLRERARKLQAFVKERFGLDSVVGVGRTLPAGESLHGSLRDAVLAAHLCVLLDTDLHFCDEQPAGGEGLRYTHLHSAGAELSRAFDLAAADEVKRARDAFVRAVLVWSNQRTDVLRGQFLVMLFSLTKSIQRKHLLRDEVIEQVTDELSSALEGASTGCAVIVAFKVALERLGEFAARALEGPKSVRLDTTLQYLKDNFAEPLRLTGVARKAGFSVPAFSRIFKQATGTSFLAYVRNLRVEQAKRLLATTTLSAEQIAHACGFQSQHHLIRSFKKVTKRTPGTYRKGTQTGPARIVSNGDDGANDLHA